MNDQINTVITFFQGKFEKIFFYNIDVVVFYLVISLAYLYRALGSHFVSQDFFLLIIANVAGIFGVYLWNRVMDTYEDGVNGITGHLYRGWLIKIALLAVVVAVLIYFYTGGISFGCVAFVLAVLGIFYSYPEQYRLKKIFLLKNIIPAFCWTLSLASLLSISAESLSIYEALKWLSPLFFLAVCFEIFWDLPDAEGDRLAGVRTLPVVIGFSLTKVLLFSTMVIFFFFAPTLATKIFSLLFGAALVVVSSESTKQLYHWIVVVFLVFILLFHGVTLWDDIQNKHVQYLGKYSAQLAEPGTELIYDYLEKNVWNEGETGYSYSEEKVIRIEYDQNLQVYRNIHHDNSVVLDPKTFTLSEFWESVPAYYRPQVTHTQEESSGDILMRGFYETSPRAGSPCGHVSVFGDFEVIINPGEAYYTEVLDGETRLVHPILVREVGPWNHCGIEGSIWFQYVYAPELGVITEFQGTIYYGNVPGRTIEMHLRALKPIL